MLLTKFFKNLKFSFFFQKKSLTAEFQANANDNTSINEKRCKINTKINFFFKIRLFKLKYEGHLWIGNIDKTKFKLQQNKELTNIESKNQVNFI